MNRCEKCGEEVKFLKGRYLYLNGKKIYLCQECEIITKEEKQEDEREEERKK